MAQTERTSGSSTTLTNEMLAGLSATPGELAQLAGRRVVLVEVSRNKQTWNCHLAVPSPLPEALLRRLGALFAARNDLESVHFIQHDLSGGLAEVIRREWPFICRALEDLAPAARGALLHAQPDVAGPEHVRLICPDGVALRLLDRDKVLSAIAGLISRLTGGDVRVSADCAPAAAPPWASSDAASDPATPSPVAVNATSAISTVSTAITVTDGGSTELPTELPVVVLPPKAEDVASKVIFGKFFKGDPVPVAKVIDEKRGLIVEGRVIVAEQRELGSGRTLVTFDLTDHTDSLGCKLFADPPGGRNLLTGKIEAGQWLRIRGTAQHDKRDQELVLMADDVMLADPPLRLDRAPEKRVELHLHTTFSAMDGLTKVDEAIARAAAWGHEAIAITDHGVVQAFPAAAGLGKKHKLKVILGMEGYLVDDGAPICVRATDAPLAGTTFVVFDTETTGLRPMVDELIELCAVKVVDGQVVDEFATFIRPSGPLSEETTRLTGITDADVASAPPAPEAVARFLAFAGDACLVAHNAAFDWSFVSRAAAAAGTVPTAPLVDTLGLARALVTGVRNYKLETLTARFGIKNDARHRATGDARATAQLLRSLLPEAAQRGAVTLADLNGLAGAANITGTPTQHVLLLVQEQAGLRNLYHLVSRSHVDFFYRTPRIPLSLLTERRAGLLIGSACSGGRLVEAILAGRSDDDLSELAGFYDFLEIQPLTNNAYLVRDGHVADEEALRDLNRRIVALGDRVGRPVVATGDVHFLDPVDGVYRQVLQSGQGYTDTDFGAPLHFRTTEEMLAEFAYLGDDVARRVVIEAPRALAARVADIQPVPDGTFPPKPEGADETLRVSSTERAHTLYGPELPPVVQERLTTELDAIIGNGYAGIYVLARDIVLRAMEDGYLVGSRGSVGSSLAAHLAGITEVNPLPAHYRCPKCLHTEFPAVPAGTSGFDLPARVCPNCGMPLTKNGQDIKFEVFMGFKGNKVPDIDLNFSGEQQAAMHQWTEEYIGKGSVYRAGTIATVAEKTAFGFAKAFAGERILRRAELQRLATGCTGVKRTTGRHPGGLVVVPAGRQIEEFTPVQFPANDTESNMLTTHFDYDSMHDQLVKLDMLGHDDPTVIKLLGDITGVDVQTIPFDDPQTLSLFSSLEALGITTADAGGSTVGTLGVPEFGTRFVRSMLEDTRPKSFGDLVRISGLSHGTMVWQGNQQDLIKNGTATLQDIVGCRDDILLYLTSCGVDALHAFNIMENVRKGKGLKDEDIRAMRNCGVPDWYIGACRSINYLFPKAHAAAYVMMAFRIAYCKVHHPAAFYATYFTVRADDFSNEMMIKPTVAPLRDSLAKIEAQGREAPVKEKNQAVILEVAVEMYARGFSFAPVSLAGSDARRFLIRGQQLLAPFVALEGLGETVAASIVAARQEAPFRSIQDLLARTKVTRKLVELLSKAGALDGLPEDDQLSLFQLA